MLTPQEAHLLASLRQSRGPLDEQQLAARAKLPAAHLSRILADLEWRGLVVVMHAAGGVVAMLTPQGRVASEAAAPSHFMAVSCPTW